MRIKYPGRQLELLVYSRGGANPESIWVCTVSGFLWSRVSAKISGNMGVLAQKYPESGQLYTKICQKKGDKKLDYMSCNPSPLWRFCIIIQLWDDVDSNPQICAEVYIYQ
jgi:hypothetical protein